MGNSAMDAAEITLSHADKMVLVTVDTLAANEKLLAWTGGRIKRADLLSPDFSGHPPFALVGVETWSTTFEIGCSEKTFVIDTLLVFEVPLSKLADDQATIAAVVEEWEKSIYGNSMLTGTRFGPSVPHAHQLQEFGAVQLDAGDNGSGGIRYVLTLQATYSLGWNPTTGSPEPR